MLIILQKFLCQKIRFQQEAYFQKIQIRGPQVKMIFRIFGNNPNTNKLFFQANLVSSLFHNDRQKTAEI